MQRHGFASVVAGLLIAILATGMLRLGHMHAAHGPTDSASSACHTHHGCGSCPTPSSPSPDQPATPSECGECALLAVLMTDGLPVVVEPFFPAPSHATAAVVAEQVRSVAMLMAVQARGPPAPITIA